MLKHLISLDSEQKAAENELKTTKFSSKDYQQNSKLYCSVNKKSRTIHVAPSSSKQIWNVSATNFQTRDLSPSYSMPKSPRFSSIEHDIKKNRKILSFELRGNMKKDKSFARSQRKNHWLKQNSEYPSGATYFKNSEQLDYNPQKTPSQFKSAKWRVSSRVTKYITIPKSEKPEKQLMYHGKTIPHHPELLKSNPGVGKYNLIEQDNANPAYTMRKLTKRFNQHDNLHPSPNAYKICEQRPHTSESINNKGTFQKSKRIFLMDPDNKTPGPGAYLQ